MNSKTRRDRDGAVAMKPKIFVFCQGCQPGWHYHTALAEDGTAIAGHVCSHHGFAMHDMGVDENGWKRDLYAKHYPDGFEVVYVELNNASKLADYPELAEAFRRNKEKNPDEAKAAEEVAP